MTGAWSKGLVSAWGASSLSHDFDRPAQIRREETMICADAAIVLQRLTEIVLKRELTRFIRVKRTACFGVGEGEGPGRT
jgi:hypothetical protein